MRILPWRYGDDHDGDYTGYLRIFFYDPEARSTFLDFYEHNVTDPDAPYKIEDEDYLFVYVSYNI